ncbi:Uncharacterised protein [Mycobacterium tuberculosis]|uniref:Uncharacterized protein n=1 Tax=Mycobacterium tuberculosis TaxID=1773 RepID=A0A655IU78_MYCTX|nr:Uncharacterised protein [Mycobacterium tuberculosis]CKQ31818.1 Uncharacterised protein [Mycobacterium tuberculosis]CKT28969.1 Uncharacterised protein [Mycobacterium tuberculosis]COW18037.1 Uncharacterised protein [Mycobacterium tuberculosis]COW43603.1 Uncharacterised protein [Mycobacterium tuberculosis]
MSGKPPVAILSTRSARRISEPWISSRGAVNSASTKPSAIPARSPCENGQSSMISTRPTSASAMSGAESSLAEPVSRNLPGLRSRSTSALIARNSPGSSWASSMTSVSTGRDTNARGSSRAASRLATSSSETTSLDPG